jgi:hypothetical protein
MVDIVVLNDDMTRPIHQDTRVVGIGTGIHDPQSGDSDIALVRYIEQPTPFGHSDTCSVNGYYMARVCSIHDIVARSPRILRYDSFPVGSCLDVDRVTRHQGISRFLDSPPGLAFCARVVVVSVGGDVVVERKT